MDCYACFWAKALVKIRILDEYLCEELASVPTPPCELTDQTAATTSQEIKQASTAKILQRYVWEKSLSWQRLLRGDW